MGEDFQVILIHFFPNGRPGKGGQKVIAVKGAQAAGKLFRLFEGFHRLAREADNEGGVGDHAHFITESDGLTDLIQGYFFS